jgi:anti-sigma factor RsiW
VTCNECQNLIEAYLDGELDLVRNLEIETHLKSCPSCLAIYQNQQSLRTAFSSGALYFNTPPALGRHVQKSLHKANRPQPIRVVIGVAAALAAVLVITIGYFTLFQSSSIDDTLAKEVVANHVRSLMVSHLTDVTSSDQHTVKPWFNNKLDFSPPVEDLADKGFPLLGGRLDYLNNRIVAALVYQKRQHLINMFLWPTQAKNNDVALKSSTIQGFYLYHWAKGGMNYWVISDVSPKDLEEFVRLIQSLT